MKAIMLILGVVLLFGCNAPQEPQTNAEKVKYYEPKKLFEYDGVSVYCFTIPRGETIYFTNTSGKVEWTTSHMEGKTTVLDKHQTIGAKNFE